MGAQENASGKRRPFYAAALPASNQDRPRRVLEPEQAEYQHDHRSPRRALYDPPQGDPHHGWPAGHRPILHVLPASPSRDGRCCVNCGHRCPGASLSANLSTLPGREDSMSHDDQIPFDHPELVANPEPRCACLLLLDTSGSMHGAPIAELNTGLVTLRDELMADTMAVQRVEIAVVSFGPVRVQSDFQSPDIWTTTASPDDRRHPDGCGNRAGPSNA